ncbi:MAG: hypothetical protein C4297_03535 [Gemmataceae bacterium]
MNWALTVAGYELEIYHVVGIGGAALIVLALLAYLVGGNKLSVPAGVAGTLGGLILGIGLGMVFMVAYGYDLRPPKPPEGTGAAPGGMPGMGGMPGAGVPGPGAPGKGGPGGMMNGFGGMPGKGPAGGRRGPDERMQLAELVAKLERLTDGGLRVQLDPEEKKKLAEALAGLDQTEELAPDKAKEKLDAALKLLEKHKATLQAAGFRWPGEQAGAPGRPGGQSPPPNPFKEERYQKSLQSLLGRLGK